LTDDASGSEAIRLDLALDRLRRGAHARIDEIVSARRPQAREFSGTTAVERPLDAETRGEGNFGGPMPTKTGTSTYSGILTDPLPVSSGNEHHNGSTLDASPDDAQTVQPDQLNTQPVQIGGISETGNTREGFLGRLLQSRWFGGGWRA
jgi:hypothetical protein